VQFTDTKFDSLANAKSFVENHPNGRTATAILFVPSEADEVAFAGESILYEPKIPGYYQMCKGRYIKKAEEDHVAYKYDRPTDKWASYESSRLATPFGDKFFYREDAIHGVAMSTNGTIGFSFFPNSAWSRGPPENKKARRHKGKEDHEEEGEEDDEQGGEDDEQGGEDGEDGEDGEQGGEQGGEDSEKTEEGGEDDDDEDDDDEDDDDEDDDDEDDEDEDDEDEDDNDENDDDEKDDDGKNGGRGDSGGEDEGEEEDDEDDSSEDSEKDDKEDGDVVDMTGKENSEEDSEEGGDDNLTLKVRSDRLKNKGEEDGADAVAAGFGAGVDGATSAGATGAGAGATTGEGAGATTGAGADATGVDADDDAVIDAAAGPKAPHGSAAKRSQAKASPKLVGASAASSSTTSRKRPLHTPLELEDWTAVRSEALEKISSESVDNAVLESAIEELIKQKFPDGIARAYMNNSEATHSTMKEIKIQATMEYKSALQNKFAAARIAMKELYDEIKKMGLPKAKK
jgi:hypothetical protein